MYMIEIQEGKNDQKIGRVISGEKKGKIVFLPHQDVAIEKKYILTKYFEKEKFVVGKEVVDEENVDVSYKYIKNDPFLDEGIYRVLSYQGFELSKSLEKSIARIKQSFIAFFRKCDVSPNKVNPGEIEPLAVHLPEEVLRNTIESSNVIAKKEKEKLKKEKALEELIEKTSLTAPHLLFESLYGLDLEIKIIRLSTWESTLRIHIKTEEFETFFSLPLARFVDLAEVNNGEVVLRFSDRVEPISISSNRYVYELTKNEEVRGKLEQLFRDIIERQVGRYIQEIKVWKKPVQNVDYEIKYESWTEYTPESEDGMRRAFSSTCYGRVLSGKIQFAGEETRGFWVPNFYGQTFDEKMFVKRRVEELKEEAKAVLEGLPVPNHLKKPYFAEIELL